ncbi:SAM-dependent methyltransferase [Actinopolymorpha cephalotaxi]|uniref:Ubiquinone/menaquinone biosynthesis C-methylase UbiE n=1 Tax=Actinopolymorpha cephalotaxi TaxID=504797 RepID=A0ABX2S3R7_9ACTN|nr:methyltransferase domain-containing protein [Actinopolymorpha cephalotaxi]NYH84249.1 ubiquinone/menaquinone biosynthesis C-methylase UbiE [Actinopolymorpha cephalotaxi]
MIGESHGGLQSPLSEGKVRALGRRMRLGAGQRVLDVGAGTGALTVLFAKEFGCQIRAVESCAEFVAAGTERARRAGVEELVEYVTCDAAELALEAEAYDAALCIGAAWVLGGFVKTAEALRATVRPRACLPNVGLPGCDG